MELHKAYKLNFKLDDEGRTVWFPRSCFGKGYILTDEVEQEIIREYRNPKWLGYGFLIFLLTDILVFLAWVSVIPMSKLTFLVLLSSPVVPILIWVHTWSNRLAAKLTVSPMKMTFKEHMEYQLLEQYSGLVTFSMVSCFFAVLFPSIFVWDGFTKMNIAFGIPFWILAALNFFFCRYMMRLKRRHDREAESESNFNR